MGPLEPDEFDEDIEVTIANRKIAMRMSSKAASAGCPIAGALADLENISQPFYLGLDADADSSDMDVWP